PLRRRVPARPGPGAAAGGLPPAGSAGRRRGHQPHRRPAPDLPGRPGRRPGIGDLMDWTKLGDEAVEITRQYLRLVPPPGALSRTVAFFAVGAAGIELADPSRVNIHPTSK